MKNKIIYWFNFLLIILPSIAIADNVGGSTPNGSLDDLDPTPGGDPLILMNSILNRFPVWLGGLGFLALLYSGFIYLTSFGDANKMESAKKNLVWTITGIIVSFAIFGIMRVILIITRPSFIGN